METNPPGLTSLNLWNVLTPHYFGNGCPDTSLTGEKLSVAKEVESTSGSGQCNAGSVLGIKEADISTSVGSY
jgi:hypothetical protein